MSPLFQYAVKKKKIRYYQDDNFKIQVAIKNSRLLFAPALKGPKAENA